MNCRQTSQLGMGVALLVLTGGCAWWYETPARHSSVWTPGSAFSITLHCESEEAVRAQQQTRVDEWLAAQPAAADAPSGNWYVDVLPELAAEDDWFDDECDSLLNTMREGSDELLSDARYERTGRRL